MKRRLQKQRRWLNRLFKSRKLQLSLLGLVGLFVISNIGVYAYYRNRLYPHSGVGGQQLDNKTYAYAEKNLKVPESIYFRTDDDHLILPAKTLGATYDWPATLRLIKAQKPWLPIAGFFGRHDSDFAIEFNSKDVANSAELLNKTFNRTAVNWSLDTTSGQPTLVAGHDSATVNTEKLKSRYESGFYGGVVWVPLDTNPPQITAKDLQPAIDQLNAKRQVSVTLTYSNKLQKASSADILSWYTITGTKVTLSKELVNKYVLATGKNWGIRVQNSTQVTTDVTSALDNQKTMTTILQAAPPASVSYTFCVKARGVDESFLSDFARKITSTLNDDRSWSLGGKVKFIQGTSGCNMNAWLSASNQMSSFGPICDSLWSCTVKPSIIINFDRWENASDAWNASNGSLDDYRSMVINHESGHWLGFSHRFCGGPGQVAPVMQQQSISLQGCTFNPWPTQPEKDTLRARLGL